jgi:hypothetical protein
MGGRAGLASKHCTAASSCAATVGGLLAAAPRRLGPCAPRQLLGCGAACCLPPLPCRQRVEPLLAACCLLFCRRMGRSVWCLGCLSPPAWPPGQRSSLLRTTGRRRRGARRGWAAAATPCSLVQLLQPIRGLAWWRAAKTATAGRGCLAHPGSHTGPLSEGSIPSFSALIAAAPLCAPPPPRPTPPPHRPSSARASPPSRPTCWWPCSGTTPPRAGRRASGRCWCLLHRSWTWRGCGRRGRRWVGGWGGAGGWVAGVVVFGARAAYVCVGGVGGGRGRGGNRFGVQCGEVWRLEQGGSRGRQHDAQRLRGVRCMSR